ncbi:MAG: hypothetical protein P8168_07005 [Deltaproteobacteria bacterium]|jgi:hypothetical protein
MTKKIHLQAPKSRSNLAVTRFNCRAGNEVYLLNLDHAGANLETPFPLSPEYPVEFSFIPPGAAAEIEVSGRVVRKQQLTMPPGKFNLRVEFYLPRWELDKLLDNRQSNS